MAVLGALTSDSDLVQIRVPRRRLLPKKALMKQDTTTTTGYHFYNMRVVIPTTTGENLGFNDEIEQCCCNFYQIVPVMEGVNRIKSITKPILDFGLGVTNPSFAPGLSRAECTRLFLHVGRPCF